MDMQRYAQQGTPDCPHHDGDGCPCTDGGSQILVNGNERLTISATVENTPIRGAGGSPYTVVECDDSGTWGNFG